MESTLLDWDPLALLINTLLLNPEVHAEFFSSYLLINAHSIQAIVHDVHPTIFGGEDKQGHQGLESKEQTQPPCIHLAHLWPLNRLATSMDSKDFIALIQQQQAKQGETSGTMKDSMSFSPRMTLVKTLFG